MSADELAETVARRVVELLAEHQPHPATGLVDAAGLAHELGVSRAYVYAHASELGGIRLGSGSKPRLRFDIAKAKAAHDAPGAPALEPPHAAPRRRRRPTTRKVAVLKSRPRAGGGERP